MVGSQKGEFRPSKQEPLFVGRKSTDEDSFYFHGKIDDLKIYNRALNEDELKELFLENNWVPVKQDEVMAEENHYPVLECLEDVQLFVKKDDIAAAAEWYMNRLGFRLLMEQPREFYIVGLQSGPGLLLNSDLTDSGGKAGQSPFIYRTRWELQRFTQYLSASGASIREIEDRGFAHFVHFRDPFGHPWLVIREKD